MSENTRVDKMTAVGGFYVGADVNVIDGTGNIKQAGTALPNNAELAVIHSVTGGTSAASKARVNDANNMLGGTRRFTPVALTINTTLTAADSDKTFLIGAPDLVITLPATALGLFFRFILAAAGLSVGTGLTIAPVAVDKVMGNGFTSADNKGALLAGAGDREGDSITLHGDGLDGYYIVGHEGTWTRVA